MKPLSPFSGLRARLAGFAGDALCEIVLNSLTGTEFQVTLLDGGEVGKSDDSLIWRQAFSLADGALFWLVAGKDLWDAAGRMILGAAESIPSRMKTAAPLGMRLPGRRCCRDRSGYGCRSGRVRLLAQDGGQDAEGPG